MHGETLAIQLAKFHDNKNKTSRATDFGYPWSTKQNLIVNKSYFEHFQFASKKFAPKAARKPKSITNLLKRKNEQIVIDVEKAIICPIVFQCIEFRIKMVIEQVTNYLFPVIIYLMESVVSLRADAHTRGTLENQTSIYFRMLSILPHFIDCTEIMLMNTIHNSLRNKFVNILIKTQKKLFF